MESEGEQEAMLAAMDDILVAAGPDLDIKKPEPEKKLTESPIDFGSIDSRILKISAEIDLIQSEEIPEFKRLKLISSLRILQSRTQLALTSLNTRADNFNLLDSKSLYGIKLILICLLISFACRVCM